MKATRSFIYAITAFAAGVLISSCAEENLYEPGLPDLDNCYGVYFPSQENLKSHELEPLAEDSEETHTLTFTVKRLKSEGDITVPYDIEPADMFTATEIRFEDGQESTTFDVTLSPEAEIGTNYDCNISIDDPQYALAYSEYKSGMDFSVIVVKWNTLKGPNGEEYGRWRENSITQLFGVPASENLKVTVQERDDKPGYFRMSNVYSAEFLAPLFGFSVEEGEASLGNPSIIVDASNPEQVLLPMQSTGVDLGYGTMSILSFSDKYLNIEPSQSLYGTYDKNTGIIQFPANSIAVADNDGAYQMNTDGLFRIVLPGFTLVDYGVTLKPALSDNGNVDIDYAFGTDVTKVKYEVISGKLSDVVAKERAQALADKADAETISEPSAGTITLSGLGETGIYTILTANYGNADGKEEYMEYSYQDFTYIAAGDDVPIVMTAELNTTDKYASLGFTSENSLEMYLCGKDIQEAYILIDKEDYSSYPPAMIEDALFKPMIENQQIKPLDEEILAEINGEGYVDVATGLIPGTTFSMMIYAYNGYKWDVEVVLGTTDGTYNIIYDTFYYDPDPDYTSIVPLADEAAISGTYDYYAVNLLEGAEVRERIGTVTISSPAEGYLYVDGLTGPGKDAAGLSSDRVVFAFTDGYMGSLPYAYMIDEETPAEYIQDGKLHLPLALGYIGSYNQQTMNVFAFNDYMENLLVAGTATGDDGSTAIVFDDSQIYARYGASFTGLSLNGFDSGYGSALKVFSAYDKLMLVPQGTSPAPSPAAPADAEEKALGKVRNLMKPAGLRTAVREPEAVEFKAQISAGNGGAKSNGTISRSARATVKMKLSE